MLEQKFCLAVFKLNSLSCLQEHGASHIEISKLGHTLTAQFPSTPNAWVTTEGVAPKSSLPGSIELVHRNTPPEQNAAPRIDTHRREVASPAKSGAGLISM